MRQLIGIVIVALVVGLWFWQDQQRERQLQQLIQTHQPHTMVLYTTTWCGYCQRLKVALDAARVPYQEYDVEQSPEGRAFYEAGDFAGVPVTVMGGEVIEGYDADRLTAGLDRMGYAVKGL
jgi:glutaredoxin